MAASVRVFQVTRERARLGAKACPWSVEYYLNGRRRSQSIGTRKEAQDFAAIKRAELVQRRCGLTIDRTWADFQAEYDQNVMQAWRSDRSREEGKRCLDMFNEVCKPRHVSGIDKQTLDQYKAQRLKQPGKKAGETLSAETVRKELRTIRAALGVAVDWRYLQAVPTMPKVDGFGKEKRFITLEHFESLLATLETYTPHLPDPLEHKGLPCSTSEWWRCLLVFLWCTGQRIGATLELRWEDANLDAGTVWSRGTHNKQKADQRVKIRPVAAVLKKIRGFDPRLFPWNHHRSTLMNEFMDLQQAAGIHLPCPGQHEHTDKCHVYGFHDFRRAHATYNYGRVSDRDLQAQMGHATFATTQRYIKYAESQQEVAYDCFVPEKVKALAVTA